MMLIDLHAHSSGISRCCRIPAPEVLKHAMDRGIDGVVLCNHYARDYVKDGDVLGFVKRYVDEYEYMKQCGDEMGCKVFFGVEVTMDFDTRVHLLIYGVDRAFLEQYPLLYGYSQQELYQLVQKHGGTLVQAHPFRGGTTVLDVHYLDGVEVNCHPKYGRSYYEELPVIARENGLVLTCGGDYHADTYRAHCGMYLPDSLTDTKELAAYLRETDHTELIVQEPNTDASFQLHYTRSEGR